MRSGIFGFTTRHGSQGNISFHMPGHKGCSIYERFGYEGFLRDFPDRDITEIPGADNLFQPETIIADTMEKYRRLYNTRATYLLINGSSAGLIAAIMTCVGPGDSMIVARNCHKAVFNALRLGNINPAYVYPRMVEEYGIAGAVSPEAIEEAVAQNPDAKAIILPSPNYYGICSPISEISDIAHGAGMKLIVDQAHGAHLKLFEDVALRDGIEGGGRHGGSGPGRELPMPMSAESSGADLVINSTHKTLASLTQSAIINVCHGQADGSCDIDLFTLEDRLQMIQSTSPSYILMESLDINADLLLKQGSTLLSEWMDNLRKFYSESEKIPGLKIMKARGMDYTKINLDMSRLGLDGGALEEELIKRGIFPELTTGNLLMCMSGVGNTSTDYERLITALKDISRQRTAMGGGKASETDNGTVYEEFENAAVMDHGSSDVWTEKRELFDVPSEGELVDLKDGAGRICASSLIPYPPGIPLICPGEVITEDDIHYLTILRARGEKVIGIDPRGRICVGSQKPAQDDVRRK